MLERWPRLQALSQHPSGLTGLVIVALVLACGLCAPWLAPWDPYLQAPDAKFLPPFGWTGGSLAHPLGTDILGRDSLSRLLHGARLSLWIGATSVLVSAALGTPLGLIAGYYKGFLPGLILRGVDLLLAFPSILLAVCIVAVLGPSLENAMLAIALVSVPQYVRMVRSAVLTEVARDYVLADLALGKKRWKILLTSIVPNVLSPVLVVATLNFAGAVLEAAGLSFIGLGAQPPLPEWGALLFDGKAYVYNAPWLILCPGAAILAAVLGFNLLGDALRDVLDPKEQGRR